MRNFCFFGIARKVLTTAKIELRGYKIFHVFLKTLFFFAEFLTFKKLR